MTGFLAALQFLTPFPIKRGFTGEQIGRSTGYFPIVGLIIGGVTVGLNYVFGMLLPSGIVNVLLVVSMVIFSGALHLDGLLDTCDGIAGHGTPEKRWKVMHDSRIGGFGAIGSTLLLLTKYVALNSIPVSMMMVSLAITPVISRWAMVFAIFSYPYARPSGLGKVFKEETGRRQMMTATLVTVALSLFLWRMYGLVIIAAVLLLTVVIAFYLKRKFAGLTGDVYGAINELIEVAIFVLVALLSYKNWLG
ncbi:adenosylcobinamide-GDP ribazoletransferase [Chloroflexota bacterium]